MSKLFVVLLLFFIQILNFNLVFASTKFRKSRGVKTEFQKPKGLAPTPPPSLKYDPRKKKPSPSAETKEKEKPSEKPVVKEEKPKREIFGFLRRKKNTVKEEEKKRKVFEIAKKKAIETAKKFREKIKKQVVQEEEFVKRAKARKLAEKEKAHEESGKMLTVLGQFRKMKLDPEKFKREKEVFEQEFAYQTIKKADISPKELDDFFMAKSRQNRAQVDFEESQKNVDAEKKELKKLRAEEELLSDEYDLLTLSKLDVDQEEAYKLEPRLTILSDRIRSHEKDLKEAEQFRIFQEKQRDLTIESTAKNQEEVKAKLKKMDVEDKDVDEYVFGARKGYARRAELDAEKKIEKLRKTVSDTLVDIKEFSDLESREDLSPKEQKRLKTLSKRINKREKEIPKLYRKSEDLEPVKTEELESGLAGPQEFLKSGLGLEEREIKLWLSPEVIKSELEGEPTLKEYWDRQMEEEMAAE